MTATRNDTGVHGQLLRPLALLAAGSTGADIERLVREARAKARRERRTLTWSDLEHGLASSARPPHAVLDWQIAIHEIGHAIVYSALGIGTVATIRIGGRGGEVAISLDVAELQDEDGVMKLIAATLGGRVAEKLVLGKVLVGAGGSAESDLAQATRLALDAETSLGLAAEMPLIYRPLNNVSDGLSYNPNLARRVNHRLEAAEAIGREVLERHADIIRSLAERLCACRVIEGTEILEALARTGSGR
ncbi:MAG: Peptidase family [Rhizobium sp.]|nr:Peptidase family [Rhizobium sp.]